ncbi:hypothetical protein [Paenibacillus pedocola]|uniref:hypothetical protein n=1 Tax=Paenibacillus pedocola TaxID=3242193 RepID=UPI00287755FF|nr:hypothetical protein [Paenibacillus typhae]
MQLKKQQQIAEFVWEEDGFADAPHLHCSKVLTAIRRASELSNTLLSVTIKDPFQINDSPLPSTTTSSSLNDELELDDLPF